MQEIDDCFKKSNKSNALSFILLQYGAMKKVDMKNTFKDGLTGICKDWFKIEGDNIKSNI